MQISLRTWAWIKSLYVLRSLRAATERPGTALAVLSLLLALIGPFLPVLAGLSERYLNPWIAAGSGFLLLLAMILFSGYIVMKTADPETYATIMVSGRPSPEVFSLMSFKIRKACKAVLDASPDIDRQTDLSRANKLSPSQIERLLRRQQKLLLQLQAMKKLASEQLDIPRRRLCDHVMQYSPEIHRDRLGQFLRDCQRLANRRSVNRQGEAIKRYAAYSEAKLVESIREFTANTKKRVYYQEQLLNFRYLHRFIEEFASAHSTSGSLLTYAEALQAFAERQLGREDELSGQTSTAVGLRFLHRKQRSHPGFDLHTLLLQCIERVLETKTVQLTTGRREALEAARNILEKVQRDYFEPRSPDGKAMADGLDNEKRALLLEALIELPPLIHKHVEKSREVIADRFQEVLSEWVRSISGEHCYIVTYGYSKAVRDVLLRFADQDDFPRIYFILRPKERTFDTRVMEYELREKKRVRQKIRLAAGPESFLLGLLQEGDSVLFLLGAECFDSSRHVVHPRGIEERMDSLLKEFRYKKVSVLVTVVAEYYKLRRPSLAEDTRFYDQHFDSIDVYSPEHIHLIITDETTLPIDWQAAVATALKPESAITRLANRLKHRP